LQAVSPYFFEMHAGSTKKHPSDYFLLENWNNLHDVLRACTNATLDMLQSAIRKAIAPAPQKRTFRCKACKSTNVFLLTFEVKSPEVTGWIYKGTWDIQSLLQHSGKLVVPFVSITNWCLSNLRIVWMIFVLFYTLIWDMHMVCD
jgi:hypothetical protein